MSVSNKKLELKRLIIFIVLAFAISWIPAIIWNKAFGYHEWFETYKYPLMAIPVSYGPALANVLTRIITREGWGDNMLHLRLKGNLKYYVLSILTVVVFGIIYYVTVTLVVGKGDWSGMGAGMNGLQIAGFIANSLSMIPLMAFNTFGEEFGWRGYMNRKMEPIFGTVGTVVIGGIIWGLWHAELTVEGHNFGTDYPGFPYLGILFMAVFCTFFGMALMWVTKKTGSIYPAAIMHAANNFGAKNIGMLFLSGVETDARLTIKETFITSTPAFLIYTIFLVLMLADNKKKKAEKAQ